MASITFASFLIQTASFRGVNVVTVTLFVTGFLIILNIGLAIVYRKRTIGERVSYYIALIVESIIFIFALLLRMRAIHHVPFPLPPGLPIDRAEIGAAIAIAIGLFPATYWHRTSLPEVGTRMAQDARTLKEKNVGIRVEPKTPGEWMN